MVDYWNKQILDKKSAWGRGGGGGGEGGWGDKNNFFFHIGRGCNVTRNHLGTKTL